MGLTLTLMPGTLAILLLMSRMTSSVERLLLLLSTRVTLISALLLELWPMKPSLEEPTLVKIFVTSGILAISFSTIRVFSFVFVSFAPGSSSRVTVNSPRSVTSMNSEPMKPRGTREKAKRRRPRAREATLLGWPMPHSSNLP
ncbi:MAG: hypothetical protein BWY86_00895 [Candidatus Aminicenantes bacterium ADurb.Bin508]|nr:MAG: hypothetical protein BWY86_00895 [Candidatus Aminicenantes bacterium ADurb.Bin508]